MTNSEKFKYKDFFTTELLVEQDSELSFESIRIRNQVLLRKTEKPVVFVCISTSAIAAGIEETQEAIKRYIADRMLDVDVVQKGSLGLCSADPVIMVQVPGKNRIAFKNITEDKVPFVLDAVLHNIVPEEYLLGQFSGSAVEMWEGVPLIEDHEFFANQQRIVLNNIGRINPDDIEESLATGGYSALAKAIRYYTPDELCDIMEKSQLRGRGGGGYLTGKKWKEALNSVAPQKFMVCNADESDPGAFMDRALMENDPHRIIEGLAIAAYAIGAGKAYIYIRNKYRLSVQRLEKAINDAWEYGLLGHNILDSGFNLDIIIRRGAGAYVCGEETALIRSLEGKRGMPQTKPPFPVEKGLFGKPTVVNNVETLANVPVIIKEGPDSLKEFGTEESIGTKIFSVAGHVNHIGIFEVPLGTSLKDVVYKILGGIRDGNKFKALQIGGPSGGIVSEENLDTPMDYKALQEIGTDIGSGGMFVLNNQSCIIDFIKYFIQFIHNESCGKCIPCREGSRRMYDILSNITRKPAKESQHNTLERFKGVIQLEGLAQVMKETSLCGLGQTAAVPVLSTLRWFRDEYEEHIFDRYCRTGVCKELRTFYIDVEKCNGCTLCAKKCPENAIIGTPRNPYFIVENKCIGCGECYNVCKFGAITVQ